MLDILLWIVVFIVALFVLIKSSDYFTSSAEKIGIAFGIPSFVIGVTIVALGTSLPELISSIFAVINNSSEIVIGNVVGSNIANIFLVLGVTAIVAKKMHVERGLINIDLPILFGSAGYLWIAAWDGIFSLGEGILGIFMLIIYLISTVKEQKADIKTEKEVKKKRKKLEIKTIIILFVSAFFIFLGAKYTIASVIRLSEIWNIGKDVIAISAVALGTSLPELFVSITAARKGNSEMAIGNVLGSNIFNTLAVMGIPAMMGDLVIPQSIIQFSLPVMLIATLAYLFTTQDQEVTQWEGWMLVIMYILFIAKLFNLF
jgi:cation:H+ antiporter